MMSSGSTCRRMVSPGDVAFGPLLEIYAEAIPARERKAPEALAGMVGREDYLVLVMESQGRILGFSLLLCPLGENFFLLEYMAVESAHRDQGLGGLLFRESLAAARAGAADRWCLVEVDSLRDPGEGSVQRSRRQRFYRREGCRQVDRLAYLLPLPGADAPPAMDLFVHQPGPPSVAVPLAIVERWLKTIYRDAYGCAPGDGRIQEMLRDLGDPVALA